MSKLLQKPGSALSESDQTRRERFKFAVFAVLGASAILLGVALVYKARQTPSSGEVLTVTGTELTNSSLSTNDP
jgi:hypothetical protein